MDEAKATAETLATRDRELVRFAIGLAKRRSQSEGSAAAALQREERECQEHFSAWQAKVDEWLAKVHDRSAGVRDLLQRAGWVRTLAEVEMPPVHAVNRVPPYKDSRDALREAVLAFHDAADRFEERLGVIPGPRLDW